MADKLSPEAVQRRLSEMEGWRYREGRLERDFTFKDFSEAFGFLCRVALLAEQANHHPELSNIYKRVSLALSTHDAGGVTDKDFALAKKIDALEQ